MTVLDANILLYAYDETSTAHMGVRAWLEQQFRTGEAIGLPWVSLWAFLRVSTNARINRTPLSLPAAFAVIGEIRSMPRSNLLEPGPQHAVILERLATATKANGPRMTDAVLAAIAIEHGAKLASTDLDFARFRELRWINPLDASF